MHAARSYGQCIWKTKAADSDISSIASASSRIMKFDVLACPSRKKMDRHGP